MCWLTKACLSTTKVIVFFKSAPTASMGCLTGKTATALGAYPRALAKNRGSGKRRRGLPSRPLALRSGVLRSGKRRRYWKADRALRDRRSQWVRLNGSRWSSRDFRRTGGEEQMVQRRIGQHHAELREYREPRRAKRFLQVLITIGRAADVYKALLFPAIRRCVRRPERPGSLS